MTERQLRLDAVVGLLPGVPHRLVLVPVVERVLAHERPRVAFTELDDGGRKVPAEGAAEAVVDAFEAYQQYGSFGVVAEGPATPPRNTMVITPRKWAGPVQGGLSFTWDLDPSLTEGFVDLLADLSVMLSAPLAVVSHRGGVIDQAGWTSRVNRHIDAIRADPQGDGRYGLCRGLAGAAHRMVLGDELAAMFGEDRLGSLPASMARRHRSGRWVLSTTEDPLAWTHDRWCPEEAAVVEALGPEHFFDPLTGSLPTVTPTVPEVAPYRCTVEDPTTRAPVELHA